MSELSVGSLSGLAANSYVVDIASGSSLDLANAKADSLPTSAISTGGILQVVSTTKSDTFSASVVAGTTTEFTGLTATITPRSTSSKIMVMVQLAGHVNTAGSEQQLQFILKRGATAIGVGDAAGSRKRATLWSSGSSALDTIGYSGTIVYLDSPSTTSSTTYGVDLGHGSSSTKTIVMNRTTTDGDNTREARAVSTITLIEVAG
jgi:hypothetical protein